MGKTVPDSVAAALSALETMGKVPQEDNASEDTLWLSTLDAWRASLQKGDPPAVRAECNPVSILLALEQSSGQMTAMASIIRGYASQRFVFVGS